MFIGSFDIGDQIRLGNHTNIAGSAAFANLAGTATDPTAVTLLVLKPDGTEAEYTWPTVTPPALTLSRESAGRFYIDYVIAAGGTYGFRLAGTGAVVAAEEGSFFVRESAF